MRHYWLDDDDAPFTTLLRVVGTYCHPEAGGDAYDDLVLLAQRGDADEEMRQFKVELRRALSGDVEDLHPDALFAAAAYGDGTDEAFLRRLWHDLYPREPVPVS